MENSDKDFQNISTEERRNYILSINFDLIDSLEYPKELMIPQMIIKLKQNLKALFLLIQIYI
jgi:hypothetical protein